MNVPTLNKDISMLKALSLLLTIFALIVSATVYVASRPNREEIRQMIDDRVAYRLDQIDKRLENIEKKLH